MVEDTAETGTPGDVGGLQVLKQNCFVPDGIGTVSSFSELYVRYGRAAVIEAQVQLNGGRVVNVNAFGFQCFHL